MTFLIIVAIWVTLGVIGGIGICYDQYKYIGELDIALSDVIGFVLYCALGGFVFIMWASEKISIQKIMNTPFLKFKRKGK